VGIDRHEDPSGFAASAKSEPLGQELVGRFAALAPSGPMNLAFS
jgi:hypothetical protein